MKIAVLCENGNTPLELIGKARSMDKSASVLALCEENPEKYLLFGVDEAYDIGKAADDCAQGCRVAEALELLAPDIVLFPATVRGRFLSAWVAARLKTGLTADCTDLALTTEGLLLQTRPAYGNNLTAEILCRERRPQMASVRPGVFPLPQKSESSKTGEIRQILLSSASPYMTMKGENLFSGGVSLQNADVIVAGGKGIGSAEGFEILRELAVLLHGAVGASRSAVDAGWISYAHQIGQTGVTVRPKLYIAFGISGFIQHTVGMSAAKTVIAVNTDRNAPIFKSADFGIVAPWRETALDMIHYFKERMKNP